MKRTLLTLAAVAGLTAAASAQTITPGLGGIAITGQSGAGIYLPWGGGASVGAPGVGSYNLSGGGYTSPYSWSNYSNPTAYNFNTGRFNYNSGVYTAGYTPWAGGNTYLQSGYNNGYYSGYNNGYYYPTYSGSSYYYPAGSSYYYPSSGYSTYSYPRYNGRRGRWR